MEIESLKTELSQYGEVQVCKKGFVFVLLMTGLKNQSIGLISKIQMLVLNFTEGKFPAIEILKNDKDFIIIVLKP